MHKEVEQTDVSPPPPGPLSAPLFLSLSNQFLKNCAHLNKNPSKAFIASQASRYSRRSNAHGMKIGQAHHVGIANEPWL